MISEIPEEFPEVALEALPAARLSKRSRASGGSAVSVTHMQERIECNGAKGQSLALTWCKKPLGGFPYRPDNRKCPTCPRIACQDDIDSKALGIVEAQWWGYNPVWAEEKQCWVTQGDHCGPCTRVFNGLMKSRLGSIKVYQLEVGRSDEGVNRHLALCDIVEELSIEKGGNGRAIIDWSVAEKRSLSIVALLEMNIQRPGYSFQEWEDYVNDHDGDPVANGKHVSDGHREFVLKGVRGVLMPDKKITKIEFNERIQAQLKSDMQQESDLNSVGNQIEINQKQFVDRFFNSVASSSDGVL